MTAFVWAACAVAIVYQLLALAAVLGQWLRRNPQLSRFPKVSILKPVHGRDPRFEEAIGSHARIDYPDFELLFGVNDASDPAIPAVQALPASLYVSSERVANPKVGVLMELERHAAGEIWVVNDGDIRVTADYLRCVAAPLEDAGVGLVTCLYRPIPTGFPAHWEALGIATDFAPSTLVAPLVGVDEFGLGSTLCFRASDLRAAGGFRAIADYLADDYQLARRLTRGLGKRAVMARLVVDTTLEYAGWQDVWKHQVRWARTVRVSRRGGYLGLPVTHAGLWVLLAAATGVWSAAIALGCARMLTGFAAGYLLLRSPAGLALPLMPLWDLWAFAVWIAGLGGNRVEWRGKLFRLSSEGRIGR